MHPFAVMTLTRKAKRSWLFLIRLQREMGYDDAMGMAAQIAFYAMLGLFPFMIFVLSVISMFPVDLDLQAYLLESLNDQMPSEAANYVTNIVMDLLPQQNQGLLSFGLLASLWGASMAIGALITTINRAYNIRPRRNIAQQKVLSIVLTLGLSAMWLLAVTIILVGPELTQKLFQLMHIASETNTFWTSVRLPMAFLLNLGALSILYYVAPEAKQRFRWILPGAVTSTILWFGASQVFRYFLQNFGQYNKTYGSLATVVILMIWLWIWGLLFLLGAEINALMKRKEEDDPPKRVRLLR
jgi:membrane protein